MNKNELAKAIAKRNYDHKKNNFNASYKMAYKAINLFFGEIVKALSSGEKVEIRKFGSFTTKKYKAYTGRNPKTGAKIEVLPKTLPVFKMSRIFFESKAKEQKSKEQKN